MHAKTLPSGGEEYRKITGPLPPIQRQGYLDRIGNCICRIPGSPRGSRMSEVDEDAPVQADEGWTEWVKCGKTAAPQTCQHLNSVPPDDGRALWGLERLQADLCRALGRVYTRPSALPDVLLTNKWLRV